MKSYFQIIETDLRILLNIPGAEVEVIPVYAIAILLIILFVFILRIAMEYYGYLKFLNKEIHIGRRGVFLTPGKPEVYALPKEGWMRRSLVERGNSYRNLLFLLVAQWIVAVAAVFLLFLWIGPVLGSAHGPLMVLTVILITIVLICRSYRARRQCVEKLIPTTPCPQCGRGPMSFTKESEGHRMLLICNHCRIEWDLGRYQ